MCRDASVDDLMRDAAWNPQWVLMYSDQFLVLHGGMPIGVQIISKGDTALSAIRRAIEIAASQLERDAR